MKVSMREGVLEVSVSHPCGGYRLACRLASEAVRSWPAILEPTVRKKASRTTTEMPCTMCDESPRSRPSTTRPIEPR
jgi:hypothetical protein